MGSTTPPLEDQQPPFVVEPRWHPVLWTVPTIVFGLTIIGMFALPQTWPVLPVGLALLLAVFATPVVAVIVDRRASVPLWLLASAPTVVTASIAVAALTRRWNDDDGLGAGLFLFVLAAVVGVYTVFVIGLFGLRHLLRRR